MPRGSSTVLDYAATVGELASSGTTAEATFYPAVQVLITALLRQRGLPFGFRTNTAERSRSNSAASSQAAHG